jgi:uncharacterized membrane protein
VSFRTIRDLLRHLWREQKWFFIPFILILLVIGVVLAATSGAAYVAPFVYSIF